MTYKLNGGSTLIKLVELSVELILTVIWHHRVDQFDSAPRMQDPASRLHLRIVSVSHYMKRTHDSLNI